MKLVKLGTILEITKGKKPIRQSTEPLNDFLPYVNIKAFETGVIDSYTDGEKCLPCEEGNILMVWDGSRSGLVGYAKKGYVGSTLAKISAKNLIDKYLFYFLQKQYPLLNSKTKGTGTPHVDPDILNNAQLVIPSEAVQGKIVNRIEELFSQLDNGVEALQTIKQQLALYRRAVLKEVFKNITIRRPIRELSSIVTSGSRGWAQYYSDEGAQFIRIGNLTRDRIDIHIEDIQYVKLPDNVEGLRSRLQPNDVLISITADLGSVGIVPQSIGEAYINQHIAMIRFNNAEQGNFMAWYLRSEYGQKDLLKNKRGAGKLGLGLDDIRDSMVPDVSDEIAQKIVG